MNCENRTVSSFYVHIVSSGGWEATLSILALLKGGNQDIVFQQNSAAGQQRETVRHDGCTNVECFPALSAPFSDFAEFHRFWIQERYACELWPSDLTISSIKQFVHRWLFEYFLRLVVWRSVVISY